MTDKSAAELEREAGVRGLIDQVRAHEADVAQAITQVRLQLLLDEAIQEEREQNAQQRAHSKERDRQLATKPHT